MDLLSLQIPWRKVIWISAYVWSGTWWMWGNHYRLLDDRSLGRYELFTCTSWDHQRHAARPTANRRERIGVLLVIFRPHGTYVTHRACYCHGISSVRFCFGMAGICAEQTTEILGTGGGRALGTRCYGCLAFDHIKWICCRNFFALYSISNEFVCTMVLSPKTTWCRWGRGRPNCSSLRVRPENEITLAILFY